MAVRIVFKDIPTTGDKFRQIVAANADSLGLPIDQALFNYSDNGPLQSTSPFRWCGNNKSVWLSVVTDDAEILSLTQLKTIAQCLKQWKGHLPSMQIVEQSMDISLLPYVVDYTVLNMIVQVPKSHQHRDEIDLYLIENLPGKIAESFERQSAELGLFVPDALKSADAIESVFIEKITPVKVKSHASTYKMAVTFKVGICAKIGPGWAVGLLLSRGHGNIIRSSKA